MDRVIALGRLVNVMVNTLASKKCGFEDLLWVQYFLFQYFFTRYNMTIVTPRDLCGAAHCLDIDRGECRHLGWLIVGVLCPCNI